MYATYGSDGRPVKSGVGFLPLLSAVGSIGGQFLSAKAAGDQASNARKTETKMAEIAALRDRTAQVQARKRQTAMLYAGAGLLAVGVLAFALTRSK